MVVAATGTVSTVVAAAIAAFAAVLVGALNYFSQTRVLREQREQLERQLAIARQGQLTERFTRAVDQLGNDKPDVRLGGIYALEQIANASPQDRRAIFEVLTSFVQVRAPWPRRHSNQPDKEASLADLPELLTWAPDVQAAMRVLGWRESYSGDDRLYLVGVDLRRVSLRDSNFERANLRASCLQRAVLTRGQLRGAILLSARLEGADLNGADLEGSDLRGARLAEADLRGARFTDARVEGAVFDRALRDQGTVGLEHLDADEPNGQHP